MLQLGLFTDVLSGDSDGIPDINCDPDEDGLSNLEEQEYGTDPLVSYLSELNNLAFRSFTVSAENFDSDGDGLTDFDETNGMRSTFGIIHTDPEDPDSDGDGLSDGEEMGSFYDDRYHLNSYPTRIHSDKDTIADSDEPEFGTDPLREHSDWDNLKDDFELSIGTDPLVVDTDFDGIDDWSEWDNPDYDPLVYGKHYSYLEIGREIVLGAGGGEWLADEHDSVYYMAGWMLSGYAFVGDIRDIAASIYHLDGLGLLLNSLALIPVFGDAEKTTVIATKFVAKHPHMAFEIALFTVKYVAGSIVIVKSALGDSVVNKLKNKGFSDDVIVALTKKGVNLKILDEILENSRIYDNSPGLADFLRKQMGESGEILSDRVTFDVKKMVSAAEQGGDTTKYLNNLKGAYAEDLARMDLAPNGIGVIRDISHINTGGPDMALRNAHFDDVVEVKSVQSLPISKLERYIKPDKITGEFVLNADYIGMHLGDEFFTNSQNQKRFVLYLNGPQSADIMKNLKMKLPERVPYSYKTRTGEVTGTVEIKIMAVNK
ncbi:MAG: hypothetical protein SCH39_10265 [Methanosarcinales archaeon]|nr:hypothetical protein [Methanosarcinales archaeon]